MKKLLLAIILLLGAKADGQVTFQKTYGGTGDDQCYSVQQTIDGGYIFAGFTSSFGAGNYDAFLMKTNANGDSLWTKTFGGINWDDVFCVQQTADSGYIITGNTYSFGIGNSDVFLIKTDLNGDTLWTKTFGRMGGDFSSSIQQTTDGGFIITGSTYSFGAGQNDVYLIKIDANGNMLWTKTFGGASDDNGNSVQQTIDGGYIIIGQTRSFGVGIQNVYLIKTDSNGSLVWEKTFGGTSVEGGFSIQQALDKGYIIVGLTSSFGSGNYDLYLIRTDSLGNSLWTKTFGGINDDIGGKIQLTNDGGIIMTGLTKSFGAGSADVYLLKTNANGNLLWAKAFGNINSDWAQSIAQTIDGGYILSGATQSFGSIGNDIYLIKTDSLGNSNFYENNTTTIITSPATIVTSPVTIVTSPPTIVTSPATQVGSGGIVTTLCTTVGLQSDITNPKSEISIFPNPTTGTFKINYTLAPKQPGTLHILNVTGSILYTQKLTQWSTEQTISLPHIANGVYTCVITSGDKRENGRLVVVK